MIIFIAFSLIYCGFLLWARYHWCRIDTSVEADDGGLLTFSVIIPVRNEAANIASILTDLQAQEYPADLYEVLVIDDDSDDGTLEIAAEVLQRSSMKYHLVRLKDYGMKGKKQAISKALELAENEIILATDGDCRVGPMWIQSYAHKYTKDIQMITGPVRMVEHDFFTHLQSLEFAGLIGLGAASLQSGNPGMCNGANLSYRKSAFHEVSGYEGNQEIASGDDEFLLQKIFRAYPNGVLFLKDKRAIVSTPAKDTLGELINQRKRWSSKWKFHKSYYVKLMAIAVFFNYLVFAYMLVEGLTNEASFVIFTSFFLLRALVLSLYIRSVAVFLGVRNVIWASFVMEIIYPFLVLFLGIASIFGHYSWKGRYYS